MWSPRLHDQFVSVANLGLDFSYFLLRLLEGKPYLLVVTV